MFASRTKHYGPSHQRRWKCRVFVDCNCRNSVRTAFMLNANSSKTRKPMRDSQQMRPAHKQIVSHYRCAFMALVLYALITACGLLSAQTSGTGAISGAITDPSAAMLVGAQIKVTDVATGLTRTSRSNDHGLYLVSLLP